MSLFQLNGSTSDDLLRELTDDASRLYLKGIIEIGEAMRLLDARNLETAAGTGLGAVNDLNGARRKYGFAQVRIAESPDLESEINEHLQRLDYEEKSSLLGIDEPDLDAVWGLAEEKPL